MTVCLPKSGHIRSNLNFVGGRVGIWTLRVIARSAETKIPSEPGREQF